MSWKETLQNLFAETQRYEPNPLQRAALSALLLTSVSGVVVLGLAAGQWFEASTPSLLLLLGSIPLTLVATLMATSHENRLSPGVLWAPALVSFGVTLSLGGGFGLLWKEESVRQETLEQASAYELTPVLLGAMRDDDTFGVLACQKLINSSNEETRQQAFKGLLTHPEHFSRCLAGTPLQKEWGKRLVDGWMGKLIESEDAESMCAWSRTLGEASSAVPGAASALMSCVLSDENAARKACCLEAMKQESLIGDRLASTLEEAPQNSIYELAMSQPLSAQLSQTEGDDPLQIMSSEMLKRHGYTSTCRAMTIESVELSSNFADVAIERCNIREKSLREDTGFWVSVCHDLVLDTGNQDQPIEQLFCEETRRRMTWRASTEASRLIHIAMLTPQTQDLIKMEKLAGIINKAAQTSGFAPADSTGIVRETESSRYSRSASNQALHKIGERKLKGKQNTFKRSSKNLRNQNKGLDDTAFQSQSKEARIKQQEELAKQLMQ